MGDHVPWAQKVEAEVDSLSKLWQNKRKRWLAVVIVVGFLGFITWSFYSSWADGKQVKKLEGEKTQLEAKLQDLERKNENLNTVVAPLLARAAKEFPGEEINKSLKKVVERLEADSPANKPLASASATVEVVIDSPPPELGDGRHITAGGYVAFGKRGDSRPRILARSPETTLYHVGANGMCFRGMFQLDPKSIMIGAPLKALSDIDFIQLTFDEMPVSHKIKSGKVIIVLNGWVRLEFDVPPQVSDGQEIYVDGIQGKIREALQCN